MKIGTDGVLLGAWVNISGTEHRILDVGTGTGVIALMVAQRTVVDTAIDAIDIDMPSITEASFNFEFSPWASRLSAHHTSLQEFIPAYKYDLIVSNPPFFINSLKAPDTRRSDARHTDSLSSGEIILASSRLLAPKGRLALVLPPEEANLLIEAATFHGFELLRLCIVRTKPGTSPKRYLMEFVWTGSFGQSSYPNTHKQSVSGHCTVIEEELTIQGQNDFTSEYKTLTKDFYLKF